MQVIHHRRNSINLVNSTSKKYGVEVDIRSLGDDLIIQHNPFLEGEKFSEWLKYYSHKFLIINVKEDGLEERILIYLKKFKIKNFFFLDQSFPTIVRLSSNGQRNCAVRVSEFESIESALLFKNKVDWIWVDTFTKLFLTLEDYKKLKFAKFKLCLVSPELNKTNKFDIEEIKDIIKEKSFQFDAVCTKFPEKWDSDY